MRTSTAQYFESAAQHYGQTQSVLQRTVDQMATGRRLLSASDDPVASTRVLLTEEAKALTTQHERNISFASEQLSMSESALGEVVDTLQAMRDTLLAAGNGTYNDKDRAVLARQLRSQSEHLLGLANSRDGNGNYLFAGFRDDEPPFTVTRDASGNMASASYVGTNDTTDYQISESRRMQVRTPGQQIFDMGPTGVFQSMIDAAAALEQPLATPADRSTFSAAMKTAVDRLDNGFELTLTARTAMGTYLQELDGWSASLASDKVQQDKSLSQLRDLDYATAATDLARHQMALQAAQTTFAKISQLTLFDLIR